MPKVELRDLSWSEVISCEPKRNVADISRHGYLYLRKFCGVAREQQNFKTHAMPLSSNINALSDELFQKALERTW